MNKTLSVQPLSLLNVSRVLRALHLLRSEVNINVRHEGIATTTSWTHLGSTIEPLYSHFVLFTRCVLFARIRHIWECVNIRTTNIEILIGTSFSQMSNFRRVKNSHVFVTPVKNSFEFFHMCDKYVRIIHTCDRFVQIEKVKRTCHKC